MFIKKTIPTVQYNEKIQGNQMDVIYSVNCKVNIIR